MKFCGECGAALKARCANCGTENPPQFKFCGECGASLTESETVRQAKGETEKDSGLRTSDAGLSSGERRQLTVMFCDLVGSTPLAEKLDPEELREVILAYQQTCAEQIHRFDGYLARYVGDGLLVYFSYPQAHDDDAPRAVPAQLGVVAEVPPLNARLQKAVRVLRDAPLQVRIGIHTGL